MIQKLASIVLCVVLIFAISTSAIASPREWNRFPVAKKGDKTHRTTLVQRMLYELPGYFTDISEIDSSFGGRTDTQVKNYQRNHSLDPDGSVGPITWTSLETKLRFYDFRGFGTGVWSVGYTVDGSYCIYMFGIIDPNDIVEYEWYVLDRYGNAQKVHTLYSDKLIFQ
jgi:peptidoglycan hydrolase-like protein with peptidoglycan-binding domain